MKRKRFTEEQIIAVLKEHDAAAKAAGLVRKHGISEATFYNWKVKFGGMEISEATRLKAQEDENAKLKKLLGRTDPGCGGAAGAALKKGRACRQARRNGASGGQDGPSERWACSIVGADRTMVPYRSRRPPHTELRARSRELATDCRRFGHWRPFVLLRRHGEPSGINRIHRLHWEERARDTQAPQPPQGVRRPRAILVEAKPNARRSLDFVSDQFAGGRRFRILNIVDDVTKECLGAIADTLIS